MLTVALDFDFPFLCGIRTVSAAVLFGRGNLTPALPVCAFVLASQVQNVCHTKPRFFFEFTHLLLRAIEPCTLIARRGSRRILKLFLESRADPYNLHALTPCTLSSLSRDVDIWETDMPRNALAVFAWA